MVAFTSNFVALRAFAHLYLVALPPWWSAIWVACTAVTCICEFASLVVENEAACP